MHDCPDRELVDGILSGIARGVDIGSQTPVQGIISPNWPSASEHSLHVTDTIHKNLGMGRVVGPWSSPPCVDFVCSPLGAFSKIVNENKIKVRTIHDLSWPPGRSVNDSISPDDFSVQYESVDSAVRVCQTYDEPCFLAKSDLSSAFTYITVRPEQWHLLGFQWQGKYYASACLSFGLRSAPYLFNIYAKGLNYMAIKKGCNARTIFYLDDCLTSGANYNNCKNSIDIYNQTAVDAGFDIQAEKVTDPSHEVEFLGIVINTVNKTLSISDRRVQDTLAELANWHDKKVCTKRQLLSLIGKLSFAARVVRAGRTFLRRLIELSKKVKYLHYKIKINKCARADIQWWSSCLRSHNGVCMFPEPCNELNTAQVWSDASNLAIGGVHNLSWFAIPFTGSSEWWAEMPIHWREMLAVCKVVATFGKLYANKRLLLRIDNQAVCQAVNTGTIKCEPTMELVRSLYFIMVEYNIECKALYVNTNANVLADLLSRMEINKFMCSMPEADICMSKPALVKYYDVYI